KRNPLPSIATGCRENGKEGVSGSSPEEGSAKGPACRGFSVQTCLLVGECAVSMEPVSLQEGKTRVRGPLPPLLRRASYPPPQNCRVEKRLSMFCMFAAPSPFALPAIMLVSPLEFGL